MRLRLAPTALARCKRIGTHCGDLFERHFNALVTYCLTLVIVVAGVCVGDRLLQPRYQSITSSTAFVAKLAAWDGVQYVRIARRGYRYHPERPSTVAFFPAFPLCGRWLSALTGGSVAASLLAAAHGSLLGAFVLLNKYIRCRFPNENDGRFASLVLLAMGLWPPTMFFRMAYSEALLLVVAMGAMLAMERTRHPMFVACLVGFGTATRLVGIALIGPFLLYLWDRSMDCDATRKLRSFALSALLWTPLACWGIVSFTLFQAIAFGEPLAFAKAQQNFRLRRDAAPLEQWGRAALLEPLWSVYDPSSPAHWHDLT
jgi:hypothetical protein